MQPASSTPEPGWSAGRHSVASPRTRVLSTIPRHTSQWVPARHHGKCGSQRYHGKFLWTYEVVVPTSTTFGGTEVGLSSIAYDAGRRPYNTLADEQDNVPSGDPARYHTLDIDSSDGSRVSFTPVSKPHMFAFDNTDIPIDNIKGIAFGRDLPDGRKTLVLVSDNNLSPG